MPKLYEMLSRAEIDGNRCIDCGEPIRNRATRCRACWEVGPKPLRKGGRKRKIKPVQAKPGDKLHTFTCRFKPCGKVFQTTNPYSRYCSNQCREQHMRNAAWEDYSAAQRMTHRVPGRAPLWSDIFSGEMGI